MATEMAMLNVRMERDKRERGNQILAELGYTPSQYVRAMWDRLIEGGYHKAKAQVDAVMAPARTPEQQAEIDRKLAVLRHMDESYERMVQTLGLAPDTFVPMTDEEIEEARYEYLLEKYGA